MTPEGFSSWEAEPYRDTFRSRPAVDSRHGHELETTARRGISERDLSAVWLDTEFECVPVFVLWRGLGIPNGRPPGRSEPSGPGGVLCFTCGDLRRRRRGPFRRFRHRRRHRSDVLLASRDRLMRDGPSTKTASARGLGAGHRNCRGTVFADVLFGSVPGTGNSPTSRMRRTVAYWPVEQSFRVVLAASLRCLSSR
jgi:hypothetical protein